MVQIIRGKNNFCRALHWCVVVAILAQSVAKLDGASAYSRWESALEIHDESKITLGHTY